jgi:hypothetical protein
VALRVVSCAVGSFDVNYVFLGYLGHSGALESFRHLKMTWAIPVLQDHTHQGHSGELESFWTNPAPRGHLWQLMHFEVTWAHSGAFDSPLTRSQREI